jgi:hypothetical protein
LPLALLRRRGHSGRLLVHSFHRRNSANFKLSVRREMILSSAIL